MVYRFRYVILVLIALLLVAVVLLAAVTAYTSFVAASGSGVASIFGYRICSIQTDSMYPELEPGDLIFNKPVEDFSDLRKKDIITYWTAIDGERVLNTHRIEQIYDAGTDLIFATKGDNNTAEDALMVHESEIVGQYAFRIGGLGKALDFLQTSTGFTILILAAVLLASAFLVFILLWRRYFI